MRDGVAYLEVQRKARALRDAITSILQQVEQAEVGARVVRVETKAANVIAKINAGLLGVSGERKGQRV